VNTEIARKIKPGGKEKPEPPTAALAPRSLFNAPQFLAFTSAHSHKAETPN
jgi:hypothetical protein